MGEMGERDAFRGRSGLVEVSTMSQMFLIILKADTIETIVVIESCQNNMGNIT